MRGTALIAITAFNVIALLIHVGLASATRENLRVTRERVDQVRDRQAMIECQTRHREFIWRIRCD